MASFGENLRRERELRGVELRDIAEATKISIRFLQALEQDRADVLPGGFFPQAFVRQYARHLGLDAERVVAEFLYANGPVMAARVTAPESTTERRPVGRALLVVGLVAGAAAVYGWYARPEPRTAADTPVAAANPIASFPPDRVYPPPTTTPAPVAVAQDVLSLTLRLRERCWISVQVDRVTVLNQVLEAGETRTLEGKKEIVLTVGNAGGIDYTLNGRPGVPLGRAGEVRRNVLINRETLPVLIGAAPRTAAAPAPAAPVAVVSPAPLRRAAPATTQAAEPPATVPAAPATTLPPATAVPAPQPSPVS